MKEPGLLFGKRGFEWECFHAEGVVFAFPEECIECNLVAKRRRNDELFDVVVLEEVAHCR